MTERGRVTASTAMEAAMYASDERFCSGLPAHLLLGLHPIKWASDGDEGRRQRAMARATRAAMATATRVAGDEEDEGVEEGSESFYS